MKKLKLYINEKLFSIHNIFYVKDESEKDLYVISKKIFSLGSKISITDIKGNVLSNIDQELFRFLSTYNISINNELNFQIKKKFQLFKNDYVLSNGYSIVGNYFMFDFNILDPSGKEIGKISRKYFTIGDKYEVEIYDKKDVLFVLSVVAVIANDINKNQSSNND